MRQIRYSQKQKSSGLTSSIEIDFNHFPHNTFNPLHSSQAPSDLHDPTISSVVFKRPVDGLKLTAHSRVTPQRFWAVMRTRPRPENPLNPEESIERQSPESTKLKVINLGLFLGANFASMPLLHKFQMRAESNL